MKLVTETSKQAYKEIHQEGIATTQKKHIFKVVQEYYFKNGVGISLREISLLKLILFCIINPSLLRP